MSDSLLAALAKYYRLVERATTDPVIVVPSEFNFVPGPGDDLESMIWVLTYAIILHHHGSLQAHDKAFHKLYVVDNFYGSLSYSGLATHRDSLLLRGSNPRTSEPEDWIPDPVQRKWFRRAMALVAGQNMPSLDGSTSSITFDAFDKLCDEFTTNE